MTVLGRGLVFQPVLVSQTCTYNSNNIALQNIGITDFPSKNKNKQNKQFFFFLRTYLRERERSVGVETVTVAQKARDCTS